MRHVCEVTPETLVENIYSFMLILEALRSPVISIYSVTRLQAI
jgi:hypothetical protein